MKNIEKHLLGINSFDDFFSLEQSLNEKDKGDLFEKLTFLVLTTKPEYVSIIKNVWLQGKDMPQNIRELVNLPNTDEGIDLIAETYRGEFWAIQCKFKGKNQPPTYKELSTFIYLANSHCRNISMALLVHTGSKGVRKKSLLGEKYSELGLEFWLNLTEEDWLSFHKKINKQSTKPKPRKPRSHQQKAIVAAKNHFLKSNESRGRLIMPCGTGKSLTAFWIANELKSKNIIIAVPSLSLIKQSLEDWTKEFIALDENPKPEWLVICSDESTGNLDKDEFVSDTYSLGIPTTTSINVIVDFLNEKHVGRKIIFTTYQSSGKLAQACQNCNFHFDLALLDEAHKTVGEKSKSFSILLSDTNISIRNRIFMTATERVIRGQNEDIYSMDNEDIYGKLFYQLTFKEAIHAQPPIICDYKILTIAVSNYEIKQLINENKLITDKSIKLGEQESQSIASAIALRKATEKHGIKHAVSFHKSIKSSLDFSVLNNKLNNIKFDGIVLNSYHISSKKSAGERVKILKQFATNKLSLITNARCLTEGVDVPAIDCVLFADPKQSIIDIVQAAGRALRPFSGKKFGYIMIPLIIPDDANLDEFIESTSFRQVGKIIAALSTQDERIVEEYRIHDSGKKQSEKIIIIEGTIPIGLNVDFYEISQKINSKIWEKVGRANWRCFEDARKFIHSLKLKGRDEWLEYSRSGKKPQDIPTSPDKIYINSGWNGMGDWLGTGTIAPRLRVYLPFNTAIIFVRSLNLKSWVEWIEYSQSGKKPENIPTSPHIVYKDEGWKSMGNWLGTESIADQLRIFLPYEKAKTFVHSLNLKGQLEWNNYCKSGEKPIDIPQAPYKTYKNLGWVGFGDWLGTETIAARFREYLSFDDAKMFVRSLNINSWAEWIKYCRAGNKPENIPTNPHHVYKNEGWISMGDWLGTGRQVHHDVHQCAKAQQDA